MWHGTNATDRGAYHVVRGDEGVVDGDQLDILALKRDPGHEPADPSETWAKPHTRRRRENQSEDFQTQQTEQEELVWGINSPLIPILILPASRNPSRKNKIKKSANPLWSDLSTEQEGTAATRLRNPETRRGRERGSTHGELKNEDDGDRRCSRWRKRIWVVERVLALVSF
jgi:hypothetical protein